MSNNHSWDINTGGRPTVQIIRDYYRTRLAERQRKHVEIISLFERVGWSKDLRDELDSNCNILHLQPEEFINDLQSIRHAPGFLVVAGRYIYVTPEIIAQVAFDEAWSRWGQNDPDSFLEAIPQVMLTSFLARVSRSASEEVRTLIGEFFLRWILGLSSANLADIETTHCVIALVETDTNVYLPILHRMIMDGAPEQLKSISGQGGSGWGPRRHLVWFAE